MLLTLIALAALLTLGLLEAVRGRVFVRIGAWIDHRLGGVLLGSGIADAASRHGDGSPQGLQDLATVRTFLTGPGMFPILDAPWTPIFLLVTFMLHFWLGILALAGAVVLLIIAVLNEMATRGMIAESGDAAGRAMRLAESALRNAEVIKAMGMMPNILGMWRRENETAVALQAGASDRGGAFSAVSKFMRLALQIGALAVGALLVIQDSLSPGAMIAGSILMTRALAPVDMAIGSWRSAVSARSAYARLRQRIENASAPGEGMTLPAPKGALTLEGVSYRYPGQEGLALRGVSFALAPGETLGLIGPTASGKTTLARLIIGNLAPLVGHVRLDGADISQWITQELGAHMGYLPQEVALFEGDVRINIARFSNADPESVVTAAKLAGAHEMILHLPTGYETQIGVDGAALSGGQRQRIALSRAVFGDPKLLVLDEPTANLDAVGEEALLSALAGLKARGATVVLIAHRPSLLRHVDKILVLREGEMYMFGPPDEVLPKITAATGKPS